MPHCEGRWLGGNYQYNGPRFLVELCMAGSTQIAKKGAISGPE